MTEALKLGWINYWNLHPLPRSGEVMGAMRRVASALHGDLLAGVDEKDLETTMRVLGRVKDTLVELDRAGREPVRAKRRQRKTA